MRESKARIRKHVLAERAAFYNTPAAALASEKTTQNLLQDTDYLTAQTIMCFVSFDTEVDTHTFIERALAQGKRIWVPYVAGRGKMQACEIFDLSELESGNYGILEPKPDFRRVQTSAPDLVIVPSVAYSKTGYRVGYGGGFYDRYLAGPAKTSKRIGIAFEVQLLETVPVGRYDIAVDKLITEVGTYTFE